MRVKLAWATDPGLHREENEDSVLVWRDRAGLDALIVVCDGMGGHAAGHLASSIAVETFATFLDRDGGKGLDPGRLKEACVKANTAVYTAAQQNPAWAGMGSTLVVVAIDRGECTVINVGDSPAFLFRQGTPKLISQDHSWPAEQVRLGVIQPEEAKDHPMKHRLTRAIGVWENIQSYTDRFTLETGDTVVLCSDGVETAGVLVEEMWELLYGNDISAGIDRVINRCRELGAPDNLTVAVAKIEETDQDPGKTVMLPALKKPS